MKKSTGKIVYIPQLHTKRTIYIENDIKYIMMDGDWWGMDGYKNYLKDKYSINISYEYYD